MLQKIDENLDREYSHTLQVWGTFTVQLTSCLTGLDLTEQVKSVSYQQKQNSRIKTIKTGSQLYSDTSPIEESIRYLKLLISEIFLVQSTSENSFASNISNIPTH